MNDLTVRKIQVCMINTQIGYFQNPLRISCCGAIKYQANPNRRLDKTQVKSVWREIG